MSGTSGRPASGGTVPGGQPAGPGGPGGADGTAVTAAAYLALLLLGLLQGLIGSFQYSRGPAPAAAILFDLAILATCLLGARGMRTALGGVLPAVGWFAITLLLSSDSANGSVFITATTAGEWFLFGGAICAVGGAVYAFARWSQSGRRRRQPVGPGTGRDRSGSLSRKPGDFRRASRR